MTRDLSNRTDQPEAGVWQEQNQRFGQLIALAHQGSVKAFEELYNCTARWLLSHVQRLVEGDQAEDVLTEVFVQVWKSLGSYDPGRAPAAVWLVMIARSRALDHLRRERRHGLSRGEQQAMESAESQIAEGPEQILSRLEQRRMVQLSLEALDENERLLVGLAYFRESSHKEIAELTGLPLGKVKSTMGRARDKLRCRVAMAAADRDDCWRYARSNRASVTVHSAPPQGGCGLSAKVRFPQ